MKYIPYISIITPNYNCLKYISETIESVLAQTYQNWEMIIIDDCSNDGSYELALEYAEKEKRIKVFRMECNSGAALCRNKAIELSTGQYLAFLDSDDIWIPEKLEKQMQFMQENDCDFSFTERELIDEYGNTLGIKLKTIKKLTYQKLLLHCWPGCSTVIYRQNINKKIYGPIVKNSNDYALFLQVIKNVQNGLGFSECLSKYRKRANSLSSNKLKKISSFFNIMVDYEHKNAFLACFYLFTNQFVKLFFKQEKI